MLSHDLYHVCESNSKLFAKLVSLLGSIAGLPGTEDLMTQVAERLKSLIDASALKWRNRGLLVGKVKSLRKSAFFKQLWDARMAGVGGEAHGTTSGSRSRNHEGGHEKDLDLVNRDFVMVAGDRDEAQDRLKVSTEYRLDGLILSMR